MAILGVWLAQHGFDLISSAGIVASLLFTAASFREGSQSRRLENLIGFMERHQALWAEQGDNIELRRVIDPQADLGQRPVSEAEMRFVQRLLFHLHAWFVARESGDLPPYRGVEADIASFFTLPVPACVWLRVQGYFDPPFIAFVERALSHKPSGSGKL